MLINTYQNQPNVITSLKTSSPHVIELEKQGPGHSEQQEVARRSPPRVDGHHKNPRHATQALTTTNLPTPPSSTPLSDISSTSALPVAIPTNIPSQTDGEAREGCSSEVKSLLGRIVEQNTARRVADQRSSAQTQPIVIPPSVLTDEVCESVAKNMGQAQKEIDAILASPQIQSLIQAAAGKQVSDASSFNPNTQSSISSPSRIPVQIPPEMLTSQGPANEYTSGHSRNNHSDRASPALSRDRGSSAEYNDDRYYHSRHEPYSPRGRGRGRGLFRARGRGRGRGRGFAPYDGGYGPYDRSDDYHRDRSFSPRRSTSPYSKYPYPKHVYDDKYSRSRSRSRSPGKGKSRYRSRSRSRSPRYSRSRSPAARTKLYRSRHDYDSVSPRRRRASDYSRSHKHSKRHSRSRSRSSIASSRSRSRSAERRHKKKKHRLKYPSRSVSPRDDKYSSKKRKHRTPSPEERRKKRHSSVTRHRDRTPSRDRKRDDKTGEPRSEASTRVSEKPEDKKLQEVQKRESTPPRASRSKDRTTQHTAEPVPAKAPSTEAQETVRPLPCHNVPGIWSARLGNEGISTFQCVFEIDDLTAKKWDISMPRQAIYLCAYIYHINRGNRIATDPRRPAVMPKQKLGINICSYLKPEIEALMQSLQPGISPQQVANKITSLEQNWPSTRDLVITIHPKLPGKKTWLSFEIVSDVLDILTIIGV